MTSAGARRCTAFEAYELAHSIRMDRLVEASPECGATLRGGEYTRVFGSLEDLVEYLEGGEGEVRKKRWWEFWK